MCAHFKGVYARYWIPEGDEPQRGMRQRTGHRRKGFSSPGQSNSGDRTHVCGLVGHAYTAAVVATTIIPGDLGFLVGS